MLPCQFLVLLGCQFRWPIQLLLHCFPGLCIAQSCSVCSCDVPVQVSQFRAKPSASSWHFYTFPPSHPRSCQQNLHAPEPNHLYPLAVGRPACRTVFVLASGTEVCSVHGCLPQPRNWANVCKCVSQKVCPGSRLSVGVPSLWPVRQWS